MWLAKISVLGNLIGFIVELYRFDLARGTDPCNLRLLLTSGLLSTRPLSIRPLMPVTHETIFPDVSIRAGPCQTRGRDGDGSNLKGSPRTHVGKLNMT